MDKRKQNGGHSTKSTGIDKRKNEYRDALQIAATVDDVVKVIQAVLRKAVTEDDIPAAKLFLEYYLGKPKESIDIHSTGDNVIAFNDMIKAIKSDSNK